MVATDNNAKPLILHSYSILGLRTGSLSINLVISCLVHCFKNSLIYLVCKRPTNQMTKQHITLENSERIELESLLKRETLKVRKYKPYFFWILAKATEV